jgi:hypothetical protein
MARYKAQECNSLLLPVILSELDARFRNDEIGASSLAQSSLCLPTCGTING